MGLLDVNCTGQVTQQEIAQGFNVESIELQHPSCQVCLQAWDQGQRGLTLTSQTILYQQEISPCFTIWHRLIQVQKDSQVEALMVQEHLFQEYSIQEGTFQLETYFAKVFCRKL